MNNLSKLNPTMLGLQLPTDGLCREDRATVVGEQNLAFFLQAQVSRHPATSGHQVPDRFSKSHPPPSLATPVQQPPPRPFEKKKQKKNTGQFMYRQTGSVASDLSLFSSDPPADNSDTFC